MRFLLRITGIDPRGAGDDAEEFGKRGIRAARAALGDTVGAHAKRVEAAWSEALESLSEGERFVIGGHDKRTVIDEAAEAAQEASHGVLTVEVAEDPNAAIHAVSDPEDGSEDGYEVTAKVYSVEICDLCDHEVSYIPDAPAGCQHNGETHFEECVLVRDIADGEVTVGGSPFQWEVAAYALTTLAVANGNPASALAIARSYGQHDRAEFWGEVAGMFLAAFPPIGEGQ